LPGARFPLVDGRGDPNLSEAGLEQARAIAARLAKEGIARLFVTSLRRTHQTAAPLAAATGLEPEILDDLSEVRLGDWEGGEYRVRAASGDPLIRRVFEEERWDIIPNAESRESLAPRARAGVEKIVERTGPDAVAVAIAHGGVIGEICSQATGATAFAFVHADNGSVSRLVVHASGKWMLRSFNDVSHLTFPTGPTG
jgi:probable phosphoglycerate mutase